MTSMMAMRRWLSAVVRIALDALRGDQNGGGIARRRVVDDLIEVEDGVRRRALVVVAVRRAGVLDANPFVGLARIIQPEIVVDGLGREHGRQAFGQRLQAVERAVAADGNQPFDAQLLQSRRDQVELVGLVGVDVVPRRADERAALGRIELRDSLEQGIQVHVRHARVEEAVEALDEPVNFDPELVGAHDGAVDRRVERGRVTASRQNADAFHGFLFMSGASSKPRARQEPVARSSAFRVTALVSSPVRQTFL